MRRKNKYQSTNQNKQNKVFMAANSLECAMSRESHEIRVSHLIKRNPLIKISIIKKLYKYWSNRPWPLDNRNSGGYSFWK